MTPADVLGPGGRLAAAFPGYEHRPGQLDMSTRIARALADDERLLVEAGTGTGKTLAYLVPAILSGRKVVISTATKTLQDQIARVDLPRLAAVMPRPFSWAVMKGLGNYVCRRRLAAFERQTSLAPDPAFVRLRSWVDDTASGDRADVPDLPDDSPLWREVASSPETRIGGRCEYNDVCFVTTMRRAAAAADIVVANHHLFFADLALRGLWPEAGVVPPYEAVIFDEAHQIEDIAGEFFGVHVSTQRLLALARDVGRAAAVHPLRAQSAASRLQGTTGALAAALRGRLPRPRVGDETRVPLPDDMWTGDVRARYHDLDAVLEEIAVWLDPEGQTVREAGRAAPELAAVGRRAETARADLSALTDAPRGSRARTDVRWIVTGPRGVGIHASPIDVGPRLAEAFAAHPGAAVFTSATLTVAGKFDYVRQRLGLTDTAAEAVFPSPFRYDRQALLYVAVDLPEPTDDRFPEAAAARAAELCRITDGRALLLFTSFRNLHRAAAHLRDVLPHKILVQGEQPRHVLLATLRDQIGSVLLATQSFWEGVDVPGEALSLVVIDRLPFAVPEDPLTAARIHRLRDDGDDPFGAYQLPRAALALKQGFGRLIRTHADAGIVALLDGRIARRGYGGTLLGSLPATCPRTESLVDVAEFWGRVHGGGGPVAAAATPVVPTAEAKASAGDTGGTDGGSEGFSDSGGAPHAGRRRLNDVVGAVLLCLGAYVLGSVPTGLLVGRARGIDIRTVGSGNIGATNVARGLGKGWAAVVLVTDALKGFLPVFLARQFPGAFSPTVVALAGLSAIVGHMFTVFLRGRGGKGVATSLGVAFGLSSPLALLCLAVYAVAYAATRLSSLGSLLGIWSFPVGALIHGGVAREFIALSVATAALVTARHRDNLRRLLHGEEKRA